MENKNESADKLASNDDVQIETIGKPADNIKEKYLFMKNKKRNSKTPIILGAVLFFAIAIAGAYYIYINKPPEKSPQEIIKSSMETMSSLKTYQIDGKINFNGSLTDDEAKSQSAKINISINGKNDAADSDNPKAYYNIKASANLENEYGSENYSADFEEMVFGQESAYFKINDYNLGMEMGAALGPQIEPYKGKWYFLSADQAKKILESAEGSIPINAGIDESKIMDIISKYEVLKFDKDLGNEKLSGVDVYHYRAKLDGMAAVYMYLDILKEVFSSYNEGATTSEEFEGNLVKIKKDIEENYRDLINEGFQKAEIEMWIGKKDGYVYRIVAKGGMDEKYVNKFLKATLGSARAKAMDAQIKFDIAQKARYLELHYDDNNGSYENFVLLENSGLKPENVRTNKDSYVIWSELNLTTDKWCVDSTGKSGYILGEISDFECPESLSDISLGEKKDYANLENSSDNQDWKINFNFNMDLLYSDFNQSMEIEKPEGAADLMDVLEPLMSEFLGMPIGQDSDGDGLSDNLEAIYKTDKNNPDTDGDGYRDGEEVKNGYDPALPGDAKLGW